MSPATPLPTRIFHVCARPVALAALASGAYRAQSLETEGFIHLSQAHQVQGVAERYYAGQAGLVLLVVDPARVTAPLRYEPPRSMPMHGMAQAADPAQLFPHIYGPLNADAIVELVDLGDFLAGEGAPG